MPSTLRVGFAGTPDFAADILAALLASQHQVVCVFTQPDRPAGRGRKPQASPVKQLAEQHQLPVHQPLKLRDEESRAPLAAADLDVLVVAAYGLILPTEVLELPRFGALNVHASLLPRWRGAAPIQRAIEHGDSESGVTIMQMDEGLDTGDMLLKKTVPIDATTTGGSLHDALASAGAEAIVTALDEIAAHQQRIAGTPQPQQGVSYAAKLSKAEALLDFTAAASDLARRVRAFNPWPVCWAYAGDSTLRVWEAHAEQCSYAAAPGTILSADSHGILVACAEGALRISRAQLPGTRPLEVKELLSSPKRADLLPQGNKLNAQEAH